MPEFPDPASQNALAEGCTRCPALVDCRETITWGNGSLDAALLVVGEAPGAGDPEAGRWKGGNWTGLAYTSRHSGRRIRDMFEALGYGPEELYFTNAVKCFPCDGEGSNREPTPAERANCRPYLLTEIEQVDPDCVVATGRHATETLLAADGRTLGGFIETVLEPRETDLGAPVLPLLHPSYLEVWVARLGHTPESYREAVGEALREVTGR